MDYHKLRRDKTVQREITFLFAQNWSTAWSAGETPNAIYFFLNAPEALKEQ
jgi:hypothetical protein